LWRQEHFGLYVPELLPGNSDCREKSDWMMMADWREEAEQMGPNDLGVSDKQTISMTTLLRTKIKKYR
jgi:hypothetical protein